MAPQEELTARINQLGGGGGGGGGTGRIRAGAGDGRAHKLRLTSVCLLPPSYLRGKQRCVRCFQVLGLLCSI